MIKNLKKLRDLPLPDYFAQVHHQILQDKPQKNLTKIKVFNQDFFIYEKKWYDKVLMGAYLLLIFNPVTCMVITILEKIFHFSFFDMVFRKSSPTPEEIEQTLLLKEFLIENKIVEWIDFKNQLPDGMMKSQIDLYLLFIKKQTHNFNVIYQKKFNQL